MIYEVKYTSQFKRSYKLMAKQGQDLSLIDEVIDQLRKEKNWTGNIEIMH